MWRNVYIYICTVHNILKWMCRISFICTGIPYMIGHSVYMLFQSYTVWYIYIHTVLHVYTNYKYIYIYICIYREHSVITTYRETWNPAFVTTIQRGVLLQAQLRKADPDIALEALSQWETCGAQGPSISCQVFIFCCQGGFVQVGIRKKQWITSEKGRRPRMWLLHGLATWFCKSDLDIFELVFVANSLGTAATRLRGRWQRRWRCVKWKRCRTWRKRLL